MKTEQIEEIISHWRKSGAVHIETEKQFRELLLSSPQPSAGKEGITEEEMEQIAEIAWRGAANAFRLYPNNKHTFSEYWPAAKNQFSQFLSSQPLPLNKEKESEAVKKLKPLHKALSILLSDEDLTDEKLREASEELLPRLHDAIIPIIYPYLFKPLPQQTENNEAEKGDTEK